MKALALLAVLLPSIAATTRPSFDPTSAYEARTIEGYTVMVNRRLLDKDAALAERTLTLLQAKLHQVDHVLPSGAREKLKVVKFWVEPGGGEVKGMCYHPSRRWLETHGYNPEKAGGIELGHPKNFLAWAGHQPWMVLHELAHAYHHQVLGYDHPGIKSAFKKAVENKSYESVLRYDGKRVRHYALNNDQEYFAEATEAWFGANDFYPFVRAELTEHDPKMAKVVGEAWK